MPRLHTAHDGNTPMNYRKRRAQAWAGLYAGLVGTADRAEGESDDRAETPRTEASD